MHYYACHSSRIWIRCELFLYHINITHQLLAINIIFISQQKISKKLHLSKFKLSRFNESGQLIVFYAMSLVWGIEVILREGYFGKITSIWEDFPNHPMGFLHKLYFIIQLAYYIHMVPEIYFQRIKKDEQQDKIIHSLAGFAIIGSAYFFNFQRLTLVLLTLHYASEFVSHLFHLVNIFDRDNKFAKCKSFINFHYNYLNFYNNFL